MDCECFKKSCIGGLVDVKDKPRIRRPARSEADIEIVRDIVIEDRRRSVREINYLAGVCGMYRNLTVKLKHEQSVCMLSAAATH